MPQIARVVDHGLTLARHYAFYLCSPSRESFLSGRFPHHGGNEANQVCNSLCAPRPDPPIPPSPSGPGHTER